MSDSLPTYDFICPTAVLKPVSFSEKLLKIFSQSALDTGMVNDVLASLETNGHFPV